MSITLDLSRVSGADVLTYWSEYGQTFAEGSPYRDLGSLIAWWGREDAVHSSVDRVLVAWLTYRQAGNPLTSLAVFAASLPVLPDAGDDDDDDSAPSGADLDAPGDES